MSAVYEARTIAEDYRVALKILTITDPEDTSDQQRVMRFAREAKVVSALYSPHVARVFDAGSDPATGTMFIAMEYLEGRDLSRLLKHNRPLRPEVAMRIAAQACLGLSEAHKTGFVHRDIKPGNLYLSLGNDGEVIVKLLDFGIAKIRDDDNPQVGLTNTGHLLGTPLYASPEQARGSRQIDLRTDIWSLGVTIYHALTGSVPYRTESIFHLIAQICTAPPPPVTQVAPWLPPEFAAVLDGALKLAPEDRFPSAEAMLAAIEPILRGDYRIEEAMLLPMDVKASVSPMEAVREGEPEGTPPPWDEAPSAPARSLDPALSGGPHETPTPALLDRGAKPKQRSWASVMVTVAAAAFTVIGLGLLTMRSFGVNLRRVEGAAEADANSAKVSPPLPLPASVTASPVVSVAPIRKVTLAIQPSDAEVELEGAPVSSPKGIVEISGVLGSIHHVRISKGKRQTSADVAITEAGALPPKLTLDDEKRKPPGNAPPPVTATPGPATPGPLPPTATPKAATSAPAGKLRTSFE